MIDKDNKKAFFLRALEDNIDTHYTLYFNVVKTKNCSNDEADTNIVDQLSYEYYAKTMSNSWILNLYITFPFLSDMSTLDITRTFYQTVKRHDLNNLLTLVSYLDSSETPNEYGIKITVDADFITKKLLAEGFIARTGLQVDISIIQEDLAEYSFTFKNVEFLDNFVAFFKDTIRDSSYAAV